MASIHEIVYKLGLLMQENITQGKSALNHPFEMNASTPNENETNYNTSIIHLKIVNFTAQYHSFLENYSVQSKVVVIFLYCLIILVSFFGNSIVCRIVFFSSSMRSTTNIYIGSLSISDLMMTVVNVPLQLVQILCRNWPLSQFFCKCLPFFQGLSVNVSSFTMAFIALDRYQIIAHPLQPRAGVNSTILKIALIWILASMASSPYPAIAGLEDDITYSRITRCRLIYPEPQYEYRQALTLITLFVQYLVPLSITGITYFKICSIIWRRKTVGETLESQRNQRYTEKWKTIKMLIIVFLVFAFCWFPLNMYHMYQDFRGHVGFNKHKTYVFLVCHWFAMSSICYNPFLYCWLNEGFRGIAKSYLRCFLKLIPRKNESNANVPLKRLRINNTTRMPSKVSTLSDSLNSRNVSNKYVLENQCSTNTNESNEREYEMKYKHLKKKKLNKNSSFHYIKEKESAFVDLEAISALMDVKETAL